MDLFELLNNKSAQIIDVRSETEYESGHVNNSRNIPIEQVLVYIEEFKNMTKPIILCCASGTRSGLATEYLTHSGIEEVYNGGSWKDIELQLLK